MFRMKVVLGLLVYLLNVATVCSVNVNNANKPEGRLGNLELLDKITKVNGQESDKIFSPNLEIPPFWGDVKQEIAEKTQCMGLSFEFYSLCLPKCNMFRPSERSQMASDYLFKSCKTKFCPSKAVDVYYKCLHIEPRM